MKPMQMGQLGQYGHAAVMLALGVALGVGGLRPAAAAGKESIKVGVDLPLSGPMIAFGKSALLGIQQRVKELNAAGGVGGAPLELVVEDNKGDKAATVAAYKKLVSVDQVVCVLGPITSTNTLALAVDSKRAQVPIISPTATNDKVTQVSDCLFRACFNDSFQGQVVAHYARTELKLSKAAVIVDLGSDYSKGLSASFRKAFEAEGGKVVAEEKYQQKDTEFGAQLSAVKASGAEIIFVPGYPPELPLIVKQAGQMGLTARFCGADGWDNEAVIENAGDRIVDSVIVGAFAKEDQRPVVQSFVKSLGADAGTFEALGYDSVTMLAQALKTGTTSADVIKGLRGIKDVEGVTGKITVLPNHDALKSAVIMVIQKVDGKYTKKYVTTVNP